MVEEDDKYLFKKVIPRETFDPPGTPEDMEVLEDYESLKDKLKQSIR